MGDAVGQVLHVGSLGLIPKDTFSGPDTSELDAMYAAQARESEKRIKALQAKTYEQKQRGVRSGGGSSTEGVPTLTTMADPNMPKKSLFG